MVDVRQPHNIGDLMFRTRRPAAGCIVLALAITILAASGSAVANYLEIRPAGSINATILGQMEFHVGVMTIRCTDVTLELDLDTTADKREGVRFGEVTEGSAEECVKEEEDAEVTFLGFPWSITYEAITGGLPSEIAEIIMAFRDIQILTGYNVCSLSAACLFRGDVDVFLPLYHIFMEEPYINQLLRTDSVYVPLEDSDLTGLECPPWLTLHGEFELEPTQTIVDV